jgi:hypothetical protein
MKNTILKGTAAIFALLVFGGLFFYTAQNTGGSALGATIPTPVALFETSLASSISSSDTSMTLVSGTDKDGTVFAGETYGFIIDEGNANEEFVIATCTGTTCTSMTRGISVRTGNTSVAALKKSHRRGASVKITDGPVLLVLSRILNGDETVPNVLSYASGVTPSANDDLADKEYVDGVAIAGAPDGNTTTKGIFEQATVAELNAGTATGTTGAILAFSPADIAASIYGLQLPSSDQKDALSGTSGTPSTSNKYVTDEDATEAPTASKIVRRKSDGKLAAEDASNVLNASIQKQFTAGEIVTAGQAAYLKDSDGKVYLADANATSTEAQLNFIGVITSSAAADATTTVALPGSIVSGLSFGDPTTTVAETTDVNQTNGGSDINIGSGGGTLDIRQTFITGDVSELTEVNIYLKKQGTPGMTLTIAVYEVGMNGSHDGTALATRSITESDLTTSYQEIDILNGTPITVKPRQKYVIRLSTGSTDASNYYRAEYTTTTGIYDDGEVFFNSSYIVDGQALKFNTKYTEQRNYYRGDNLYLSDTAGTIALEPGTFQKKVGRILDSSTMIVQPSHEEELIYQVGFNNDNDGNWTNGDQITFPIPRNTRFVRAYGLADAQTQRVWVDYPLKQGASGSGYLASPLTGNGDSGFQISGSAEITISKQSTYLVENIKLYFFK